MRKEFNDIIVGWSNVYKIDDIPKRLKLIEDQFTTLQDDEQTIVNFMKEVQQLRERFRGKPN